MRAALRMRFGIVLWIYRRGGESPALANGLVQDVRPRAPLHLDAPILHRQ